MGRTEPVGAAVDPAGALLEPDDGPSSGAPGTAAELTDSSTVGPSAGLAVHPDETEATAATTTPAMARTTGLRTPPRAALMTLSPMTFVPLLTLVPTP
ncbi:hypothetical protein [Knoellia sp. LjRoot47]|uniref:hypothetical protein n=1 Tax=Knoellia sp. LjRoot47 TaxID=3342330 RepID=UPI003ED0208C